MATAEGGGYMTTVERLADWAASVQLSDVPGEVVELCRAQRRSVLGAMAASVDDEAATRIVGAVEQWSGDGAAPLLGRDKRVTVEDALYAGAALSIALDFDDYVCFGHTGHSAVLTPLLLAAETGASGGQQLVAQIVANEIGARLGGACLIGPLNGQLWSFIHAAGAALAASRLLGLDARRMAHALAIALYQAPRPVVPGFMAPDSKLLTASEPAVLGLRSARLAAAGTTGPVDVLDRRDGFLAAFADAPLPGLLGGLGEGWATRTLCVKPYPGCAYLDTTLDALLELGPVAVDDIDEVTVDAGILTCGMDAMSAPYATAAPTAVTVNFSVPWNVAIAVVAGELTPRQMRTGWLRDHHAALAALVGRVHLRHDWALTADGAGSFLRLLPPRVVAGDAGVGRLRRGLRQARAHHPSAVGGLRDLRGIGSLLRTDLLKTRTPRRYWDPSALENFTMAFPARVEIRLRSGRVVGARADVPRGGAGHPVADPHVVSAAKLREWGPRLWGEDGTSAIDAAIGDDADNLWTLLSQARGQPVQAGAGGDW